MPAPLPRKALMALLRDKKNMPICDQEASAFTTCLALSQSNQAKCMPHKRALDYCILYEPHHDRTPFRMRRGSFLQDILRTSRALSRRAK